MLLADSDNMYLHYWYDDYKGTWTAVDFNQKKQQILLEQKSKFYKNKQDVVTGDDPNKKDYERTLEIFLGDKAQAERERLFSQALGGKSVGAFLHDVKQSGLVAGSTNSYSSLSTGLRNGTIDLSDIVNTTQKFLTQLNKNLDETFNRLFKGANWESYKKNVVEKYIETKSLEKSTSSEIGIKILEDFKRRNEKKFIKMDVEKNPSFTAGIDSSLQQIALIAAGLGSAKDTSAFKSDSSYFSAVGSLMAGLMTEVANEGLELIATDVENKVANGIIAEELKKINISPVIGGAFSCGVEYVKDPKIEEDSKDANRNLSKSTSDTRAVYVVRNGNGYFTLDYGINVKNYQVKGKSPEFRHVKLKMKDSISFMKALENGSLGEKGTGFYSYLFNLAGGHPEKRKNKVGTSGPELTERWKELVKLVSLNGLLMAITGLGSGEDNSMILTVNGYPFKIDEVLNKVLLDTDKTDVLVKSKIRNRGPLMEMNKWRRYDDPTKVGRAKHFDPIHSKTDRMNQESASIAAQTRSSEAITSIYDALQSAKITIDLNFYFSKL